MQLPAQISGTMQAHDQNRFMKDYNHGPQLWPLLTVRNQICFLDAWVIKLPMVNMWNHVFKWLSHGRAELWTPPLPKTLTAVSLSIQVYSKQEEMT